jgi:hypothetical protein
MSIPQELLANELVFSYDISNKAQWELLISGMIITKKVVKHF